MLKKTNKDKFLPTVLYIWVTYRLLLILYEYISLDYCFRDVNLLLIFCGFLFGCFTILIIFHTIPNCKMPLHNSRLLMLNLLMSYSFFLETLFFFFSDFFFHFFFQQKKVHKRFFISSIKLNFLPILEF